MAINRIKIKDFLVFKKEFAVDFCPGVNVIIGGNGTGKTTLLKIMYGMINNKLKNCFCTQENTDDHSFTNAIIDLYLSSKSIIRFTQGRCNEIDGTYAHKSNGNTHDTDLDDVERITIGEFITTSSVYIPEKEMLSHSRGLLALKHERPSVPFDDTLTDIIAKAQLYPKKETPDNQLCNKIRGIIGGEVTFFNDTFFLLRDNVSIPIAFSMEASGYRKFGLLWTLIRNGSLEDSSTLFWDEPENSLNPNLVSILVDILLELARNGVQIFLATHSEILASYFSVNRNKGDKVMFYSLYKNESEIVADTNDRFDLLEPNNLTFEPVRLYERKLERGAGGNG